MFFHLRAAVSNAALHRIPRTLAFRLAFHRSDGIELFTIRLLHLPMDPALPERSWLQHRWFGPWHRVKRVGKRKDILVCRVERANTPMDPAMSRRRGCAWPLWSLSQASSKLWWIDSDVMGNILHEFSIHSLVWPSGNPWQAGKSSIHGCLNGNNYDL